MSSSVDDNSDGQTLFYCFFLPTISLIQIHLLEATRLLLLLLRQVHLVTSHIARGRFRVVNSLLIHRRLTFSSLVGHGRNNKSRYKSRLWEIISVHADRNRHGSRWTVCVGGSRPGSHMFHTRALHASCAVH